MRLSMKDVVQLNLLNQGELVTGGQYLEEKMVEWVSVIEMPVENFVRKNEFVLSTGIGCGDDEKLFKQFVQEVVDSHAAGLALAVGRYIHELPQSIIDLANHHNFPILLLPWDVRFADVVQAVMQALKQEEERLVKRNEKIQQELLNVILNNGDLSDIANYLEQALQKPVIITNKRGEMKGYSKESQPLHEKWKEYLRRENHNLFLHSVEINPYHTTHNAKIITLKKESILQYPIQSASDIQGFLIVEGFTNSDIENQLNQQAIHLLEHAVTAIALCFLKENTILETEMKLRDDFVWGLAKEKTSSWDIMLSRAKSLNYNIDLPYICLIGCLENATSIFPEKTNTASYENWKQTVTRGIEDEIYYTGKTLASHTMYTFQREQFIVYLEIKNGNINETVFPFLNHLEKRLKHIYPDLLLSWGISRTAGQRYFYESYQEAQKALEIGKRQKGPGQKHMYSDTRVDRALMALIHNEELKEITEQTIASLLKYDRERGINLVHTFVSYSRNKGNVSQTARDLNLHRQSLLYRLRKIEKLTDCSLDNPDDVFLIELAIKLWTIGNLE